MHQNQTENKKGAIAWMAGHSVTANLLMIIFLIGGFIFSTQIKQEVFPNFDLDTVQISVSYPGASPQEIDEGVVIAIEESIRSIEAVESIESVSSEGSARITVEMTEGENIQKLAQDIQNAVDRISSLPEDIEDPNISVLERKRYVVSLALYGDQPETVLREYADKIRDRLTIDPNITQVDFSAVRNYEISINISQTKLRLYNLTLGEIANRIRATAVEIPGGAIKTRSGDILLRVQERCYVASDFENIPIVSSRDGSQILLKDIATITDGFEEIDRVATFNGKPAVLIEVYRVGDQTPIVVSNAVREIIDEIKHDLPQGLEIALRNDLSDIYRQRLELMLTNGYIGLALVFVLLAIFLEIRLAFWVSLGIPISFLGSFLILPGLDLSINMITMFAFIVSLGIVVDDAIVIGENIHYHHENGLSWYEASITGAQEIVMPVSFSVFTNMVTFMPIMFVPGFMGKVFKYIPIVVISVFAVSLVESIFILPAHLGHQKEKQRTGLNRWIYNQQQALSVIILRLIKNVYGPLVGFMLRYRYATVATGFSILIIILALVKSGRMGFELFPKVESDYAKVTVTLPFGTAFEKTLAIQNQIVKTAKTIVAQNGGDKLCDGIFSQIDSNVAEIMVYLTSPKIRPMSTAQFVDLWRQKVDNITGAESILFESDAGGPGRGSALSIELSHSNVKILEQASEYLAQKLHEYPEVRDIDDGFSPGKRQINFRIKPEARLMGLDPTQVASQIRHAYYGAEVLRQQRGRNEVKVTVRLPLLERKSEYSLEEMILRTPSGIEIPFNEAVSVNYGRAYTSIKRRDGRQIITVTADVRPRSKAGMISNTLTNECLSSINQKYDGLLYRFSGRQEEQRKSMESLMNGLMLSFLVIYAMLAIPLNSFIQPMIIMTTVPFGIIGAVIGHLIMGFSLSVMSMFGIVALLGVVVNDSLVLIDAANRRRQAGFNAFCAIQEAGIQRFRPILLTTLTTFGGLSPMIFETSRQAKFLIPMAISLGFGIVFATIITLILIPSLYLIIEDIRCLSENV